MFKIKPLLQKIVEEDRESILVVEEATIYRLKDQKKLRYSYYDVRGVMNPEVFTFLAKIRKVGEKWFITDATIEAIEHFNREQVDYRSPLNF